MGCVGELSSSQPSSSILRIVAVPLPVHEAMSVLASATNRRGWPYRGRSWLKNSVSLYVPRIVEGLGGIYAVISVNVQLGDLNRVATASM